ncbi:MAG: flavin-containing monooxygenase [Porticoccaceae bacterium]
MSSALANTKPVIDKSVEQIISELDFDPVALKAKHLEERDKRIRNEGNQQYTDMAGEFSRYIDDPYAEGEFSREPLFDEVEVVIIGGGFGGLLAGKHLRDAGVKDIRVIEKGSDFGGTWYWNRYPGAMCDIESYVYLPLLEELNYIPKEKYSHAPEILEHSKAIARHYNLYENACLRTEVTEMKWDEDAKRWIISTNRGDRMTARFVAMSNGPLNRPKLPGIPGIARYKGHSFHTSRWDYDYTGGDSNGNLWKLKDKRVGIIGTGATAIQCIPDLGASAQHLYVFQRTPSSIDVRNNAPTDPEWAASLERGWHRKRMDNFNILTSGGYQEEDLVADGWTDIFRNVTGMVQREGMENLSKAERAYIVELADFKKMEQVRARAAALVEDKKIAEALKPWYRQFCKRPCFHDEYLQTYNRPNVTLVDTLGQGVERITEKGVVVNGKEYEVDCLIFATGFETGTSYTKRSGYDLIGRGGQTLSAKWEKGLRTCHGLFAHGFPNLFVMGMTQTGFTASVPHALDEQAKHLSYVLKRCRDENIQAFDISQEAEDEWVEIIHRLAKRGERFYAECTPGYYNNEGHPKGGAENGFLTGQYGGGPVEFFNILEDWRNEGNMKGLQIS